MEALHKLLLTVCLLAVLTVFFDTVLLETVLHDFLLGVLTDFLLAHDFLVTLDFLLAQDFLVTLDFLLAQDFLETFDFLLEHDFFVTLLFLLAHDFFVTLDFLVAHDFLEFVLLETVRLFYGVHLGVGFLGWVLQLLLLTVFLLLHLMLFVLFEFDF